jgi:hypothetical protein
MKITVPWDTTMCNVVDSCKSFEGTFSFNLQGRFLDP